MKDKLRRTGTYAKEKSKDGYKRGRKGMVYFLTHDKTLQAVMTSSGVGIILSTNEGVSAYVRILISNAAGLYVPTKLIAAIGSLLIFAAAFWANQNTEEWREYVRVKTGEDEAVDEAEAEDEDS